MIEWVAVGIFIGFVTGVPLGAWAVVRHIERHERRDKEGTE